MEPYSEVFFERCWQCRAIVPNGLVQRKMMATGYALGRGNPERYEMVSLCGVCVQNTQDEARALGQERSRVWGFLIGLLILTVAGFPFPASLLIMCVVAWVIHRRNKKQSLVEGHRRVT